MWRCAVTNRKAKGFVLGVAGREKEVRWRGAVALMSGVHLGNFKERIRIRVRSWVAKVSITLSLVDSLSLCGTCV